MNANFENFQDRAKKLILRLLLTLVVGAMSNKSVMGQFCSTTKAAEPKNKYSKASCNPDLVDIATVIPQHQKCKSGKYPNSVNVVRFFVDDALVPWNAHYSDYEPVEYTSPIVLNGPVWADPEINIGSFNWNTLDGKVSRRSFVSLYKIVDGKPRNPVGRTGITGRGLLGKWGPNHAADPIVTRWKRNNNGEIVKDAKSGKKILQFVSIQRKDSLEWALPGGMVDDEEEVSFALKREFGEEALNALELSATQKNDFEEDLKDFFTKGCEIYKGYVDDPRNTDNAWMETVAVNFHDEDGTIVARFPLSAGDDAGDVKWVDIDATLKLYASHLDFVRSVAENHGAHWS